MGEGLSGGHGVGDERSTTHSALGRMWALGAEGGWWTESCRMEEHFSEDGSFRNLGGCTAEAREER